DRHKFGPDRKGGETAVLPFAQQRVLVKTNPGYSDHVGAVTGKPGISRAVGGAGFTADIASSQHARSPPGSLLNHILEHGIHQVYHPLIDYAGCINVGVYGRSRVFADDV